MSRWDGYRLNIAPYGRKAWWLNEQVWPRTWMPFTLFPAREVLEKITLA